METIEFVSAALSLLTQILSDTGAAALLIERVKAVIAAGGPSQADWDALDAQTKADQATLDRDAAAGA